MTTKKIGLLLLSILILAACSKKKEDKMFSLLAPSHTNITFKNVLKETPEFNVLEYGYFYNGGGIAVGDINNDGLVDIYFTGNMVGSHLYLNQGDFNFKNIAVAAGVFAEGLWNTGTTMADVNGDGFLDIYVCRSAAVTPAKRKNLLFINNGNLTFTERGAEFGVDDAGYSTQGAFFDYDKDGDLDLYVLNHSTQDYAGFGQITASLKQRKNPAYADKLYRNDNGKFTNVSEEAGLISNVLGFGLGISVSDVNNDGWPDLYVSNDYNEQDYLYINNKNGSFSESLQQYIGHTSLFSMGSDIADINNDGYTDILTLDMLPESNSRQKMVSGPDNYDKYQKLVSSGFYNQTMRNMLQLNNEGNYFSEIGQLSGISNTDWSWAPLFTDLDNDGFKDLYITNGYKRDYTNMDFMNYAVQEKLKENKSGRKTSVLELIENMPATIVENYTYHNNGNLVFTKVNEQWGLEQKSLSHGASYADLDNDGDMDLIVNNTDDTAFIYQNNSEIFTKNNYVKIALKGNTKNTYGIGAKVHVTIGALETMQEMMPTRGFQSSVDYNLIFGLGKANKVNKLQITWPDGKTQTLLDVMGNQTITLNQQDAIAETKDINSTGEKPFLSYATSDSIITYSHRENNFIDFKREQLLPHKLSTQGPNIAKGDVNQDGYEDIFIGGAKGTIGQLFLQNSMGKFIEAKTKMFEEDAMSEDIGALFFDADGDHDLDLYVVSGGNEYEATSKELQDRLYLNSGHGNFKKSKSSLPSMITSGSCVKSGDFDNDGDLDLFIGGRSVPGRYPTIPRSYILENDGKGHFSDITESVNPLLVSPGMVTDAIWTDFDTDGKLDLMIVGEFMPVRIFQNTDGKLSEVTQTYGLQNSQGWWNRIQVGDFDNDGDPDYILGNFGLNSQLKASYNEPVQLYAKDFDNNGSIDPILTCFVMGEKFPVFSKDDLLSQLSGLKDDYVTYAEYANAKIDDILNEQELADAQILEAKNFASSYLENLGSTQQKFKISELPIAAQFSPITSILIDDFNEDGHLDALLAGNFYGTRVKYGRYDANKGLLLLGDGKGDFSEVKSKESGLNLHGEVKDMTIVQLADTTQLVLFAINNGPLQIYRSKLNN